MPSTLDTLKQVSLPKTERLELRLLHPDDAKAITKLMTPGISKWLSSWPPNISEQEARLKIAKYQQNNEKGNGLTVGIYRLEDDNLIGSLSVGINPNDPTVGIMGYWIGEAFQGQGYLGEIIGRFADHAFAVLDITTLAAGAQEENHASFAMMQKLGMQPAGKKTIYVPSRDREEDVLFYSMPCPKHLTKS